MKLWSGKTSRLLWVNNAWCIYSSVVCVMKVMSGTRADTYANELKNTKDRQWETTSEFSNLKKVSEQVCLFYIWHVFLFQSKNWNQRQTNNPIQFAPNCLFRVMLAEIILFSPFYIFPIVYQLFLSLFYSFYHTLAFATFLSVITWF